MLTINFDIRPRDLLGKIQTLWSHSAAKILDIENTHGPGTASPVFTVEGRYTAKGWTEWTQGFQFGSALLQYDATDGETFLAIGRENTLQRMAPHVSHIGVHDHGFNNVSTYGNLRRLLLQRELDDPWAVHFCELAIKVSGAVQASRWMVRPDGGGYIYSFNGPQSLFIDTIRSCRALALAHQLGHVLLAERDESVDLLGRLIAHARTTAEFNIFYGEGRDVYDTPGRVCHEALFNTANGDFRAPSSQQGYSPFTTWMRGLAWAILGYAEQLEFLASRPEDELARFGGRDELLGPFLQIARMTSDFFIANTPTDGVAYWDSGAAGLSKMGDYLGRPADPFNDHEPVDSSASVIAAQGLLRLGRYLHHHDQQEAGDTYWQAGLTVADRLFDAPYLSTDDAHQGLILHSVYHRPKGWDHIPAGQSVPCGESSMWGDYHARELALYIQRIANGLSDYTFFSPVG